MENSCGLGSLAPASRPHVNPEQSASELYSLTRRWLGSRRSLDGCSLRCAGALAVRARLAARLALRCCFVGGLGPLAERACDGLVARGNASLSVFNSSVGACLFAGLRAHEAAVVKVFHSSVSQCGLALGVYGNCLIG